MSDVDLAGALICAFVLGVIVAEVHGKMIENRRWNTNYRGPILLHASKGCTVDEYEAAVDFVHDRFGLGTAAQIPPLAELPRGGIVGRARILGVLPPRHRSENTYPDGVDGRWHMTEQFGFLLADIEPLPFVAWPGSLSIFNVPDNYATSADAQAAHGTSPSRSG